MYDVIVIGGGPGGYLSAERAGHAGLKTLLIEKRELGGVCLNEGCVPSKTFLNSAKVFEHAKHGEAYGVSAENAKIDQKAVVARKNQVVKTLVAGVGMQMKAHKVTVLKAEAKLDGRDEEGFRVLAGGEVHHAKHLILATGSEAIVPPIPGVKEGVEAGYVLTNREVLDLEVIPERMVIVGGGVIGLEMASYFQTVGSQVTVIEMMDHIAGVIDDEIATLLQKNYAKKGIEFKLKCKVTSVEKGAVHYEDEKGEKHSVAADYTLLSIGRRAAVKDLGLETLGIYTERGAIVTDDQSRTNVAGVYAIGDANGTYMLAHAAYREGEVAVNTILGKKDRVRYDALPAVIYTNPEVAYCGETEASAKAKGIEYKKITIPMAYSGRYLAETDKGDGICKLIVDGKHDRLIGCHLLGSYASEIIMSAVVMIESQMRLDEIKELIFPHPTVAEIIREAIFMLH